MHLAGGAQQRVLNFTNISTEQGLSENTVLDIVQDPYGYMWFATENGLTKFDGANYTVYRHDVLDSTSLASDEIQSLCIHGDELFIAGVYPTIISAFNLKTEKFRTLFSYDYEALVIGTTDLTHYGPSYGFAPRGVGAKGNAWAKDVNDKSFIDLVCAMRGADIVREARERQNACGSGATAATIGAAATLGASMVRLSGTMTKLYPSGGILVSDAEDVARAHRVAMERGTPGERYIVGTENTKYFLLLELLYTVFGFRPVSIPMPRFSAYLMGWLSDSFAKTFGKAIPSIPSLSVVKRTYLDLFLSSEKATIELGMRWTPLKRTLEKTVDWLRENRML